MQQPEVHLHPKAQAELVSLLCQLAIHEDKTFVIETHSDYMIDRMRIEIMNGNFNPEEVSLVYLEPKGSSSQVQVHNITFDDQANMIGVPPGYRKFLHGRNTSSAGNGAGLTMCVILDTNQFSDFLNDPKGDFKPVR